MSMLDKNWTEEEMAKLNRDLEVAKIKVFIDWGFSAEEIGKVMRLPESVIRATINKQLIETGLEGLFNDIPSFLLFARNTCPIMKEKQGKLCEAKM